LTFQTFRRRQVTRFVCALLRVKAALLAALSARIWLATQTAMLWTCKLTYRVWRETAFREALYTFLG
jgi:hypothetical protein